MRRKWIKFSFWFLTKPNRWSNAQTRSASLPRRSLMEKIRISLLWVVMTKWEIIVVNATLFLARLWVSLICWPWLIQNKQDILQPPDVSWQIPSLKVSRKPKTLDWGFKQTFGASRQKRLLNIEFDSSPQSRDDLRSYRAYQKESWPRLSKVIMEGKVLKCQQFHRVLKTIQSLVALKELGKLFWRAKMSDEVQNQRTTALKERAR